MSGPNEKPLGPGPIDPISDLIIFADKIKDELGEDIVPKYASFYIRGFLDSCLEDIETREHMNGIDFIIGTNYRRKIIADKSRIYKVLDILSENLIKATRKKSKYEKIRIRSRRGKKDTIVFEIGEESYIIAEDQENFRKEFSFNLAPSLGKEEYRGLGVHLYYSTDLKVKAYRNTKGHDIYSRGETIFQIILPIEPDYKKTVKENKAKELSHI